MLVMMYRILNRVMNRVINRVMVRVINRILNRLMNRVMNRVMVRMIINYNNSWKYNKRNIDYLNNSWQEINKLWIRFCNSNRDCIKNN